MKKTTKKLPAIQISSADMKEIITALINDFIRIEKTERGLDYQQKSNFKMGQINIIVSIIGEKWDFHGTGQSYHDFLKYLVKKYKLSGVSRINDLKSYGTKKHIKKGVDFSMKKSTQMILNHFPAFKKHINSHDSVVLKESVLADLDNQEQTFLCLLWFFEDPKKESFNLGALYKNLDDDWLSIALESILTFFTNDTYLIKEPGFSIITDKDEFLNQSDFVKYLKETKDIHGKNFSRPMLNTYLSRGDIPQPDLVVGSGKFWKKETCENYVKSLQESR